MISNFPRDYGVAVISDFLTSGGNRDGTASRTTPDPFLLWVVLLWMLTGLVFLLWRKFQNQTDPRTAYTDGDGFSDAFEVLRAAIPSRLSLPAPAGA